jgi:hypothetical protein
MGGKKIMALKIDEIWGKSCGFELNKSTGGYHISLVLSR